MDRFRDEILKHYKPIPPKRDNSGTYQRVRHVVAFLSQHPSVKSTSDLTPNLIQEYAATCGYMKESSRVAALKYLRAICGLAVKWRCLKRNPFDRFTLPRDTDRDEPPEPKGRKLDDEQVRVILAYLKARTDTWTGHRLYVFVSLVVYAGLHAAEALNLKRGDCDLARRLIRIPRRTKSPHLKPTGLIEISQDLVDVLAEWFPKTNHPPVKWNGRTKFGERRTEDGKGKVPDEAQLRAREDMKRWRAEGWSYKRIAAELDAQCVPTKFGGARWHASNVHVILKRAARPEVAKEASPKDQPSQAHPEPTTGVDWVFPAMVGKGRWTRNSGTVYTALQQIHDVGNALGIEGLTIQSLRRYYHDHKRTVLELGRQDESRPSGCPVVLRGSRTPPLVLGDEGVPVLTEEEYSSLLVLVKYHPGPVALGRLQKKSHVARPDRIIRKLAGKHPVWPRVLDIPPRKSKNGWGLKWP